MRGCGWVVGGWWRFVEAGVDGVIGLKRAVRVEWLGRFQCFQYFRCFQSWTSVPLNISILDNTGHIGHA